MVFAGVQPQPAAQNHRQHGAGAGKEQRIAEAFANQHTDRLRIGEGGAQIAVKEVEDILAQLDMEGLIQAELDGHGLHDLFRKRIIARQDPHRIARRKFDDGEVQNDDHHHNKKGGDQSF